MFNMIKHLPAVDCVAIINDFGHPVFMRLNERLIDDIREQGGRMDKPMDVIMDELADRQVDVEEGLEPQVQGYKGPLTLIEELTLSMYQSRFELGSVQADALCAEVDHVFALSSKGRIFKIQVSARHASRPRLIKTLAFDELPRRCFKTISSGLGLLLLTAYDNVHHTSTILVLDDDLRQVATVNEITYVPYIHTCITMMASLHLAMLIDTKYKVTVYALHGGRLMLIHSDFADIRLGPFARLNMHIDDEDAMAMAFDDDFDAY